MSRTTARSAAMQMIFEKVSGGQGGEETLKMVYDELRENGVPGERAVGKKEPDEEDRAYISRAFNGVLEHLDELDDIIDPDVPANVSVAEALELTERYSDPEDKPFVNGILGTVVREKTV